MSRTIPYHFPDATFGSSIFLSQDPDRMRRVTSRWRTRTFDTWPCFWRSKKLVGLLLVATHLHWVVVRWICRKRERERLVTHHFSKSVMTLVPGSSLFKFPSLRRKTKRIVSGGKIWKALQVFKMKSLKWTYNKTKGICPWLQLPKPPNYSEKARREGGPNGDVEERMSPQTCQTSGCHKFSVWR